MPQSAPNRENTGRTVQCNKPILPELLAPAGSLNAFHAAINAGADAIYLGLDDFNARLRAKNFSIKTLSYLVPYSHERRVRIYVTLNTIIKQSELGGIINTLCQLESIGVDGIIVADLGIAHIIKNYFPGLCMHASTQMGFHNSIGVKKAQLLGMSRIILPRELTLDEIRSIRQETSSNLEIFVHGALCYSLSGMCLASSFLGGSSGNRGRCTQVCRRLFTQKQDRGFYFSPYDLQAIDLIPKFCDIGIAALKIEGRMKSAEYVHQVVSVYRKALDFPDQIQHMKEELQKDLGRKKTIFFLHGTMQKEIINSLSPAGSGILLGRVKESTQKTISLVTDNPVVVGDFIRIQNANDTEGHSLRINAVVQREGLTELTYSPDFPASSGDFVFLTSKNCAKKYDWSKTKISVQPAKIIQSASLCKKIVQQFSTTHESHKNKLYKNSGFSKKTDNSGIYDFRNRQKEYCTPDRKTGNIAYQRTLRQTSSMNHNSQNKNAKTTLSISINALPWLALNQYSKFDMIQYHLTRQEADLFETESERCYHLKDRLILALPPFFTDKEAIFWRKWCKKMAQKGFSRWIITHISHEDLLPDRAWFITGSPIWILNQAAVTAVKKLGGSGFSYSIEDDILNLRALARANGFLTVYGYVPLFISRIKPPLESNTLVTDSRGEGFKYIQHGDLHYLLGEKPLSLSHKKEKLLNIGINNFILDFNFCSPDPNLLSSVQTAFEKGLKISPATQFNLKVGLK